MQFAAECMRENSSNKRPTINGYVLDIYGEGSNKKVEFRYGNGVYEYK